MLAHVLGRQAARRALLSWRAVLGQLSHDSVLTSSLGTGSHIWGRQNTYEPAAAGVRCAKCQALSPVGRVDRRGAVTEQHMPLATVVFSWPTDHLWTVGGWHRGRS